MVDIASVTTAGNNGYLGAVTSPGCISSAITVGSTSTWNLEETISFFSNHSNLVDLLAPGGEITSSTAHSRTSSRPTGGTSMAAPHVTGAFAVLRQAKPDAPVSQIEYALKQTGTGISYRNTIGEEGVGEPEDTGITKPLINIPAAKSLILSGTLKPDLIVQDLIVSDDEFNIGDNEFNIDAIIKNIGPGTAPETTLNFYLSTDPFINVAVDTLLNTAPFAVNALPLDTTNTINISNLELNTGNYWVGACVSSVAEESNIDNNCSVAVAITVWDLSDLIIMDPLTINNQGMPITRRDTVHIEVNVKNIGLGASEETNLTLYQSTDSTISTEDQILPSTYARIESLNPNQSGFVSAGFYTPNEPGDYFIGACINEALGESDANNNCSLAIEMTVLPRPEPDDYESDNVRPEARNIENGQLQTHSFHNTLDPDWVTFSVQSPIYNVVIETSSAASDYEHGDTTLILYKSLNSIAFNDDKGISNFSKIKLASLDAGEYYIKVEEKNNNTMWYNLSLNFDYTESETDEGTILDYLPAIISAAISSRESKLGPNCSNNDNEPNCSTEVRNR